MAPQTAHIPARAGRAHLTCFIHYIVCPLFGVIYFCLTVLYIFIIAVRTTWYVVVRSTQYVVVRSTQYVVVGSTQYVVVRGST